MATPVETTPTTEQVHVFDLGVGAPGAERLKLLDVCAGVSGVVDEHRAVTQTSVDVVTVVQAPAAAPHWFTRVVRLNHRVGQQTENTRDKKHLKLLTVLLRHIRHIKSPPTNYDAAIYSDGQNKQRPLFNLDLGAGGTQTVRNTLSSGEAVWLNYNIFS